MARTLKKRPARLPGAACIPEGGLPVKNMGGKTEDLIRIHNRFYTVNKVIFSREPEHIGFFGEYEFPTGLGERPVAKARGVQLGI